MADKKPAIPPVPKPGEDRARFDRAVKENIETITGRRLQAIQSLNLDTATAADCAAKINEILARLQ
jgi:hypothetical protein